MTAKIHTLSMNITQLKHMHLICKLSINRITTYTPRIQDKMAEFTKPIEPQSFIAFFINESIHEFSKPWKWIN